MDLEYYKQAFDLRSYLNDSGVQFFDSGKNVTRGWCNIRCLFCADSSNHLGIAEEDDNHYSCWSCGERGDIISLIQVIDDVSFEAAERTLKAYQFKVFKKEAKEKLTVGSTKLPEFMETIIEGKEPELVKRWFKKRNFDLSLCQVYKLGFVDVGEYTHRLIIPVYFNDQIVTFQAADLTGRGDIKYRSCPPERSTISIKEIVYGLDQVGDQVILVEGVTDKWRMGLDAVALFGKVVTEQQIKLIVEHCKHKKVKVLLDGEAKKLAQDLYNKLSDNIKDLILIELDEEQEPDTLSQEDIDFIINL